MTPHQPEETDILAQSAAERLIVALDLPTVDFLTIQGNGDVTDADIPRRFR